MAGMITQLTMPGDTANFRISRGEDTFNIEVTRGKAVINSQVPWLQHQGDYNWSVETTCQGKVVTAVYFIGGTAVQNPAQFVARRGDVLHIQVQVWDEVEAVQV